LRDPRRYQGLSPILRRERGDWGKRHPHAVRVEQQAHHPLGVIGRKAVQIPLVASVNGVEVKLFDQVEDETCQVPLGQPVHR
jgi:hypothetical protein